LKPKILPFFSGGEKDCFKPKKKIYDNIELTDLKALHKATSTANLVTPMNSNSSNKSNYSKQLSRKLEVYKSLNGDSISVTPSTIKVVNEYEDIKDKHLYLNDSFNHSGRFDIKV
jgi:hypothetical protein